MDVKLLTNIRDISHLRLVFSIALRYAFILERNGLVIEPGWAFRLLFILSLTVGSMFVMWLGEQISLFGIGNGSSMIIFAGIVARFPGYVGLTYVSRKTRFYGSYYSDSYLAIFLAITAVVVFLERGERKIPVQYTRRIVGQRVYGGQSTYIPFKIKYRKRYASYYHWCSNEYADVLGINVLGKVCYI